MGVNLKMKEGDFLVMRGESVHQEAGVFSAFFVCRMQCSSGVNLKMKEGNFLVMRGDNLHWVTGVFSLFFAWDAVYKWLEKSQQYAD
jgi:hypothetical protein